MKVARSAILSFACSCAFAVHAEVLESNFSDVYGEQSGQISTRHNNNELIPGGTVWNFLPGHSEQAELSGRRWYISFGMLEGVHKDLGFWPSIYWFNPYNFDTSIASLGYTWRNLRLEGALYRGRDSDQYRNAEASRVSFTAKRIRRLSYRLGSNMVLQLSRGTVTAPDQLRYDSKARRTTASISYNDNIAGNPWNTSLAIGRGRGSVGTTGTLVWLESVMRMGEQHTVFGRFERGNTDQLFRIDEEDLSSEPFRVNKLSMGYLYELKTNSATKFGIGGLASKRTIPNELLASNAAKNISYTVFFRMQMPFSAY